MLTPNILHHKWSCHMLHVKDRQRCVTRWTSGLCDPAIGATLHRRGSRCSISCSRWLNSHLKKWFICPHMAGDERGAALSAATTTFLLSFTAPGASYFLPLVLLQWRYAFIKGKRPKSSLAPKLKVGMPEHISALACRLPCVHVCAHVQFVLFLNSALSLVRVMDPANKATDTPTTPSPRYYSCCMVSVWSSLRSLRACRDLCANSINAVRLRLPNFRQCSQFFYTRVCMFVWSVNTIFKQRLVYSGERFKSWTVSLTPLIVGA